MAKPISLPSQKKLQELFDYRDGELYWKEKIHPSIDLSKPAGYVEKSGYRGIRIEGKVYRAHRLVWKYHYGKDPVSIRTISIQITPPPLSTQTISILIIV
jgi:hypothetical protein